MSPKSSVAIESPPKPAKTKNRTPLFSTSNNIPKCMVLSHVECTSDMIKQRSFISIR